MEATAESVASAFAVVLGQEQGDRRLAEQRLTALEVLDSYPIVLANLTTDEQVTVGIRQLAAITLKQYVYNHWSETECPNFKPPQPSDEVKLQVRIRLLQSLGGPVRLIRTAIAQSITAVAQYDWPDNWPNLLGELTRMLDEVAMGTDLSPEQSKAITHGAMQALVGLSAEVSDLDIPQITPVLIPSLVRILCDGQRFGDATRRNAVSVISNLVNTTLTLNDKSIFYAAVGCHLRPCINSLIAGLTSTDHSLEESAFESEVIQLLTNLCVEVHGFVSSHLDGGLPGLTTALWQILQRVTNFYVQLKVLSRRRDLPSGGQLSEDEDVVDSDGESIEYDNLVYSLLEFLNGLASTKRYRSRLGGYLPDVSYQLARLLQLPDSTVRRWSSSVTEFLEDTQEALGCSVRLSALDVMKKFSELFPGWSVSLNKTLNQLFSTAELQHSRGDPDWWKLLEVALLLVGTFSSCLVVHQADGAPDVETAGIPIQLDAICGRYLLPSLRQSDLPFLKVAALHCIARLSIHDYPGGPRLEDLPAVLADALSQSQPSVLRVASVKALGSVGSRLRQVCAAASTPVSAITQHLPNLVASVVDCLSSFGEPILDDGLYALYAVLRIDPQGFTLSAQSQVTAIMVDLFKHCLSVASTLSVYLDILHTIQETGNQSSSEALEQAFLPMLLTCLEQQDTLESVVVEAAMQVLCVLIRGSTSTLNSIFMQRIFPAVVHIAITSSDSIIISRSCEVLRCYLAVGVDRVLEWHDDEGNNGIGYILHVTSRLLDPSGPAEWATAAGRLVCALLLRVQIEQLRENSDLLLRGTLARLSTLPLISSETAGSTRTLYTLDDGAINTSDLVAGSVGGARQSLIFVFIVLCRLQPQAVIDFLSSVPDPLGQPVMAKVMRLWCACQPFYFASHEIRVSVLALSNLLLHAIKSGDARLMQITTTGEEIDDVSSNNVAARTRNKQGSKPKVYLQIPLLVKMYKLLIHELAKLLEEEEDGNEEEEEEDTDNEYGEDEDGAHTTERLDTDESTYDEPTVNPSPYAESDDDSDGGLEVDDPIFSNDPVMTVDIKEHLCELFRTLSQQPFYNEFSRYHTGSELAVLQQVGVLSFS
ncbi:Importin 9 [Clonorchis sinensis]|uniref:Importin 9 n=1 Tax=Clonorchis sinensis TaxID=79923 RepID=A0A8T1MNT0_CLOSI|nr:Importin 9 [Clonorchis sinensis]